MNTVWIMIVLLGSSGHAAVTLEFATRDSCLNAHRFIVRQPETLTAYCVPADRRKESAR